MDAPWALEPYASEIIDLLDECEFMDAELLRRAHALVDALSHTEAMERIGWWDRKSNTFYKTPAPWREPVYVKREEKK